MKSRYRLLFWVTAITLAGAVLVAIGSNLQIRSAVRQRISDRIQAETSMLADRVSSLGEEPPQEFAVRAARSLGVRVTLITAEGRVVADSAREATGVATMDNHLDRPEVRDARTRGKGQSFRVSDTTNVQYLYCAGQVEGQGPIRYVRLALPRSEIDEALSGNVSALTAVVLTAMALMALVAYAAVRRLSQPLEAITEAVERVAGGEFSGRIPAIGSEEAVRLASAVGQMQSALLQKVAEFDDERRLLSSVIGGMREALLLVGADRRIRLANRSLREVFDLGFDPSGHLLAEVVRDPTLIGDVERSLAEGREIDESVVRLGTDGSAFEVHVTPLGNAQGGRPDEVLVLLFDITRLETLEHVRRQFVANVSHELRTPLTSIKAFVENLLDDDLQDPEGSRRFLEIIQKHADRMAELVEDLTDLSLIETGAIRLDVTELDAAEVAREVVEQLAPLAERQGVTLTVTVPSPFPLQADRRRFEQTLTNLVSNAIKFNQSGGKVALSGRHDERLSVIGVEDTGPGIPHDCLEKVFHRFYRVDEGRSREAGGTGLGLAIVKRLMRLAGGQVRVESELGHGSTFFLEFPRSLADSGTGRGLR